ncbi:hypothetical protein [Chitinophaga sancti]|uniref:Uncharacterized protein n=2 Tax=Chitinophaga sancti TaxID=1004 RepID=A0A1K1MGW7_9BACT|nr:hypothetical protein [Chitinophaga sancti]WQD62673.1 hypothetical protein U0033_32785 [Chitinophaga sancti]WQG91703.1 hypothetical protein SR876_09320 [Chitinophaga sancti]SFW22329.1 hypothetical protein SAMN05661012_00562 [Chitinophaga sancti]
MIEFEQIFFGAYFILEGDRIRINEEQLEGIDMLIDRLGPILIDRGELTRLKFVNKNGASGPMVRESSKSQQFIISPCGDQWNFGLGNHLFTSKVTYVHELQRAYFSLLGERLFFDGDEPPKKQPNVYYSTPDELNFQVLVSRSDSNRRYQRHDRQVIFNKEEDYYLVNCGKLLVRSKRLGFAIWEVADGDLIFAKGNRISVEDTLNAKHCMKMVR